MFHPSPDSIAGFACWDTPGCCTGCLGTAAADMGAMTACGCAACGAPGWSSGHLEEAYGILLILLVDSYDSYGIAM